MLIVYLEACSPSSLLFPCLSLSCLSGQTYGNENERPDAINPQIHVVDLLLSVVCLAVKGARAGTGNQEQDVMHMSLSASVLKHEKTEATAEYAYIIQQLERRPHGVAGGSRHWSKIRYCLFAREARGRMVVQMKIWLLVAAFGMHQTGQSQRG